MIRNARESASAPFNQGSDILTRYQVSLVALGSAFFAETMNSPPPLQEALPLRLEYRDHEAAHSRLTSYQGQGVTYLKTFISTILGVWTYFPYHQAQWACAPFRLNNFSLSYYKLLASPKQ